MSKFEAGEKEEPELIQSPTTDLESFKQEFMDKSGDHSRDVLTVLIRGPPRSVGDLLDEAHAEEAIIDAIEMAEQLQDSDLIHPDNMFDPDDFDERLNSFGKDLRDNEDPDATGTTWDSNWMIGVDEAGRGPVIGPLVVAALAIPSEDIEILSELNVKDSKDLSPNERLGIFTAINQRIEDGKLKSGLILCSPKRIDINSLTSDLNSLEIDLFSEAILATDLYLDSGVIRADACDVNENRFRIRLQSSLGEKWKAWRIIAEHGMDSKDSLLEGPQFLQKFLEIQQSKKLPLEQE